MEKKEKKPDRVGTFRTDGQGVQETIYDPTKVSEAKKLPKDSVAARRKRAAAGTTNKPPTAPSSTNAAPPPTTTTSSTRS